MTQLDRADTKIEMTEMDAAVPVAGTRSGRRWVTVVLVAALVVSVGFAAFALGRATTDDADSTATGAGDAAALVDEGLQLHVEGDLAGAGQRYREAIDADPESLLAHYNLGLIHQVEGRAREARLEYQRVVELDPAYVPALFNLGILAAADGDAERAMDLYRRVIEADPAFANAQFNLGLLLLEAGDVEAGNAAVQAAIALDPALASRLQADEG
jgi:tetratricopeptide (TPR) repeat protein